MKGRFTNDTLKYTFTFVIYSVIMLFFTLYPKIEGSQISEIFAADKIAHVIQFFLFSFLYYKMRLSACLKQRVNDGFKQDLTYNKYIFTELFLLGLLLSVLFETLQIPITGRTFDWYDVLANLIGIQLFILLFIIIQKKKIYNKKRSDKNSDFKN